MDREISKAYEEVVHWWRNMFKIPSGGQGKAFVQDSRTSEALQTTKSKDHIKYMERRHSLWKQGYFKALLEEGRAIQGRLQPNI